MEIHIPNIGHLAPTEEVLVEMLSIFRKLRDSSDHCVIDF